MSLISKSPILRMCRGEEDLRSVYLFRFYRNTYPFRQFFVAGRGIFSFNANRNGTVANRKIWRQPLVLNGLLMIISRQGKRGYAPRKAPIRFKESSNPQRGKRLYAIGKHRRNSMRKLFLDSEPEAKRSHRRRRLALDGF